MTSHIEDFTYHSSSPWRSRKTLNDRLPSTSAMGCSDATTQSLNPDVRVTTRPSSVRRAWRPAVAASKRRTDVGAAVVEVGGVEEMDEVGPERRRAVVQQPTRTVSYRRGEGEGEGEGEVRVRVR